MRRVWTQLCACAHATFVTWCRCGSDRTFVWMECMFWHEISTRLAKGCDITGNRNFNMCLIFQAWEIVSSELKLKLVLEASLLTCKNMLETSLLRYKFTGAECLQLRDSSLIRIIMLQSNILHSSDLWLVVHRSHRYKLHWSNWSKVLPLQIVSE